jgi:hypothetical protein
LLRWFASTKIEVARVAIAEKSPDTTPPAIQLFSIRWFDFSGWGGKLKFLHECSEAIPHLITMAKSEN